MTPSAIPVAGQCAEPIGGPAVLSCPIETLKLRSDFLRAAQASRQGTAGFMLQARQRDGDGPGAAIRVGFTCSRKVGNAVTRNRAKRRLRAIARQVMPGAAQPGWDYVLVGRPGATVTRPYDLLVGDLLRAIEQIHRPKRSKE
ncbi:ribonuclease P protein component [Halodurantibacterium flavum]|uniref:Ribonuclease P protein component n=1 Tax=Halodurantibacterium flavum TaxID=1382802 RepID=A0ABW4S6T2_9RHOB